MREPSGVAVTGVGHRLGSVVEDNETLCRNLDITPEWILEKTGIERRYLAADDETASGLSLDAARSAMGSAGVGASDIDLIVCCTFSADYRFPALAAKIHSALGVKGGQMLDVQANCTGFVTGLTVASDRMRIDPDVRNALVIGVEMNSRFISPQQRRRRDLPQRRRGGGGARPGSRRRESSPPPSTPTARTTRPCACGGEAPHGRGPTAPSIRRSTPWS